MYEQFKFEMKSKLLIYNLNRISLCKGMWGNMVKWAMTFTMTSNDSLLKL